AGSINSSVNDMTNWLKVWISGGFYKGKEILPTDYVRQAASSQMVMEAALPAKHDDVFLANYGLGWMIGSYRGHYSVEHGGNINGFSANVAFFPSDKLGIVVLTNQNGSKVPTLVTNSIADVMLKLKLIDWNGEATAETMEANKAKKEVKKLPVIQNTSPSHPLKDYVGSFENPAYGIFNVRLEDNALHTVFGDEKILLKHMYYDVFDPKSIDKNGVADTAQSNVIFNFYSGVDGKINSIVIFLDGSEKPVVFDLKPEIKTLSLKILENLVGDYMMGQTPVKVYLKGNVLFVSVPGQPEYETVVVDETTFDLKILKGFSVKFENPEKGKVNELTFIQPNGTFK
ncbi:MAG: serine hydrolase, partial [Pedobacter sp.]